MSGATKAGISVIVPCYNSGDYIIEAVESIAAQPLTIRHEILIMDDGSDDPATGAALGQCRRRRDVRVVLLPTNNGAQRARNSGLHAARYDYIMPLDCDDRLTTDPKLLADGSYPEQAVRILTEDPDVAFVHTMSQMFGEFDGLTISAYPCDEQLVVRKHHVPMPIVYRRRDGLAAGGYDPDIRKWQDWAFAIDLLATRYRRGARNRIGYVAGPHHHYRIHSRWDRISGTEVSEMEMTTAVVRKNLDYFQAMLDDPRPTAKLAELVHAAKPDRLAELLHMAAFDLDQALEVARQRKFTVSSPYEPLGIP